jgi:hypothetical protein
MRLKKFSCLGSALVLSFGIVSAIGFAGVAHAAPHLGAPYTCTWTGTGGNSNFSTAENWSGCNSAAPQPGDSDNLVFDNTSLTATATLNNDIANLTVGNIEFTGSNTSYADVLSGNTITITGGVTDSTVDGYTGIANTLIISGNQTFSSANQTNYQVLQGSGNITVTGGGIAAFDEPGNSQTLSGYTGAISSTNSIIQLSAYGTFNDSGMVSVSGSATLDLFSNIYRGGTITYDVPIELSGNGNNKWAALNLDGGQGNATTNTLSGAVTLNSDIQVTADQDNTLDITGLVSYNGYTINSVGAGVTTITVASGDNESGENPIVGNNVTYVDDGTVGNTTVNSGGLLKGLGTVGNTNVESGGNVAPGHSPGCLTVDGNLTETGTYTADLDGTTACTGYDQLDVTGAINLTGSTLAPVIMSGFTPITGNSFELIDNQGSSPITGTFSYDGTNLTEGSTFTVNGIEFTITYKGDGGNNVVISVVNAPKTPNTGLGLTKTYAWLPLLGGLVMASGVFFVSRRIGHSVATRQR